MEPAEIRRLRNCQGCGPGGRAGAVGYQGGRGAGRGGLRVAIWCRNQGKFWRSQLSEGVCQLKAPENLTPSPIQLHQTSRQQNPEPPEQLLNAARRPRANNQEGDAVQG